MDSPAQIPWVTHAGTGLSLSDGEAHIWSIPPSREYLAYLNEAETLRYGGMSSREAAQHFASAQGGLRKILGEYLSRPPQEIAILRGVRGKPYVAGGPEFNITHTGEHILVALARVPVGLDIEISSRRVSARELAHKFFSAAEAGHLESLDEAGRGEMFLRYWVCKEATVKLSGDGIYHGLRDAGVGWNGLDGPTGAYRGRGVWLRELRPAPGVVAALAAWQPLQAKCFLRF